MNDIAAAGNINGYEEAREMKVEPPLYENGMYYVKVMYFRDPVLETDVQGYGVFNRDTQVREAEVRRLAYARILADRFEEELTVLEQDGGALASMQTANTQAV
jgi:hypothetical protein